MALNYDEVMSKSIYDIPFAYTDIETMLYALSVGMGRDPLNGKELPYVYEQGGLLHTMPTLSTVASGPWRALTPDSSQSSPWPQRTQGTLHWVRTAPRKFMPSIIM